MSTDNWMSPVCGSLVYSVIMCSIFLLSALFVGNPTTFWKFDIWFVDCVVAVAVGGAVTISFVAGFSSHFFSF